MTKFICLFVSPFDIWLCPTRQCERLNTDASVYSSKFSVSNYSQIYDILLSSLFLQKIWYLSYVISKSQFIKSLWLFISWENRYKVQVIWSSVSKTQFIKSLWLFISWENRHKVQVIWYCASHYLFHSSQQMKTNLIVFNAVKAINKQYFFHKLLIGEHYW